jgi:hypothetical protein
MTDRDVPAVAQIAADGVGKIVEKYMPAFRPPTAEGIAALQGAFVLSLGYVLQRGTQGMPEVQRMRMLYNMIDKIRADLVKLTSRTSGRATNSAWQADGLLAGASAPDGGRDQKRAIDQVSNLVSK